MSEPLSKVLGLERKKESPHDEHTMDDNWCYDCNMSVQDDDLPVGNNKYNQALNDLDQRKPEKEELVKILKSKNGWLGSNYFSIYDESANLLAQEIINKIDVWIVKR